MESTDQTTQHLMFSLIELWKNSEKTQQEFCRDKELAYNKFQYWFRKYRAIHSPAVVTDEKPGFREIEFKDQLSGTSSVEVVYPDGRKLIFHQPVAVSFLRSLLQ